MTANDKPRPVLRIKLVLAKMGLSQSKAARLAEVAEASFSRIVRGIEPAYPKRGQRIADAIGWRSDWRELFEEVDLEEFTEATLSGWECKNVSRNANWKDNEEFECSECGYEGTYELGVPNYCPNCGRKVRA